MDFERNLLKGKDLIIERPFLEEEIFGFINRMKREKTLGLDGFTIIKENEYSGVLIVGEKGREVLFIDIWGRVKSS